MKRNLFYLKAFTMGKMHWPLAWHWSDKRTNGVDYTDSVIAENRVTSMMRHCIDNTSCGMRSTRAIKSEEELWFWPSWIPSDLLYEASKAVGSLSLFCARLPSPSICVRAWVEWEGNNCCESRLKNCFVTFRGDFLLCWTSLSWKYNIMHTVATGVTIWRLYFRIFLGGPL